VVGYLVITLLTANLLLSLKVKEFLKSIKTSQRYRHFFLGVYFRFVEDVMFAHNGPYDTWLIGHTLKVTHQGAEPGAKCDVLFKLL